MHRRCWEKKAEIPKDLNLEKTKEGLIEATYYFRMYSSDACWKEDVNLVQANLDRLESKIAKLDALKENIRMRVKGCGLSEAHITWSHKHEQRSVTKSSSHLEWIIGWEKNQDIPDEPHIKVPQQKNDATLGTQTLEAQKLDEAFDKKTESIRGEVEQSRKTREARGESTIYLVMQPMVRPKMLELVDTRIDVLYPF